MLSLIFEWGTVISGFNAWLAFRMQVNKSAMGSMLFSYQLALVTPGIMPVRAISRNVRRDTRNLRK